MATPSKKPRNTTCNADDHESLGHVCACVHSAPAAMGSDEEPICAPLPRDAALPHRGIPRLATYAAPTTTRPASLRGLCVPVRVRPHSGPDGNDDDSGGVSRGLPLDPGGMRSGDCMPVSRDVAVATTGPRPECCRTTFAVAGTFVAETTHRGVIPHCRLGRWMQQQTRQCGRSLLRG